MDNQTSAPLLSMEQINKSFPGVHAVKGVNLELHRGEVLALLGENGAGKTTLMNILNGVLPADSGEIRLNGESIQFESPLDAQAAGIGYIHQELNLIDELTVKENLFLTREPKKFSWIVDYGAMREESRRSLDILRLNVDPDAKVGTLPIALRQMVEITKALIINAQIIVMDEPTSSLTDEEIETLFELIREFRDRGTGIIYISHRIEEIFEITDRVMVMRNGEHVGESLTTTTTQDALVRMMAGTEVEQRFFKRAARQGDEVLRAENLSVGNSVKGVSFQVRRGEIVGIAGLMGSGRTELLEAVFGVLSKSGGSLFLDGKPYSPRNPNHAVRQGIAYLPEDRGVKGLFLDFGILPNVIVSPIEKRYIFFKDTHFADKVRALSRRLNISTPTLDQLIRNLSGGNRQKVIIARWMLTGMKVLLVNEPTRGIDVETKSQIYELLYELNENGIGILLVSSELPEVLTVSDRILVMYEGEVSGEFSRDEATKEKLLKAMTSVNRARV